MSLKIFALITTLPGVITSEGIQVEIPVSRLYPVIFTVTPASIRSPSSVGIALFADTAHAVVAIAS